LNVSDGTTLRVLADVRAYLLHLPERVSSGDHYQRVGRLLLEAANGDGDLAQLENAIMVATFHSGKLTSRGK
jgi:hypothetical protein